MYNYRDYEIPIGDTYILDARKKLGSGAFGEIFGGKNIKINKEVAIKLELNHTEHPQLIHECKLYIDLQGGYGIPNLHWCGFQGNYNILIIELLGHSLEDLFNECGREFSLLTTLMLVDQMISCIEFIHSRNIIHRDVKPDNFLMGRGNMKNKVYITDFGLSKRYYDPKTGSHIPYKEGKSLTGTARYASINTHLGIQQSRRDDIESLGYIMVYFMNGKLPWQGIKAKNTEEKYKKIKKKKISISLEELCEGLPEDFITFIQYARDLEFEEKPDYVYLGNLIKKMSEENQLIFYYNELDWLAKKKEIDEEKKESDGEKETDQINEKENDKNSEKENDKINEKENDKINKKENDKNNEIENENNNEIENENNNEKENSRNNEIENKNNKNKETNKNKEEEYEKNKEKENDNNNNNNNENDKVQNKISDVEEKQKKDSSDN